MGETNLVSKIFFLKPSKQIILLLSLAGVVVVGGTAIYAINRASTRKAEKPVVAVPKIDAVTALGRIEPLGEAIELSPSPDLGGTRIDELLVKEGDRVIKGQTIAILDNYGRAKAAVALAERDVKVAQANLAKVKAGAKQGDIEAQAAAVRRFQAQLTSELVANRAEVARLQAQLSTETVERQANINRLQAELANAKSEFQRYQKLAAEGVISDSELDSRRLTLDTAQTALTEAQASYNKTINTLREQIAQAQAIAQQNRDTLQQQIAEAEATLDSVSEVREVDVLQAQAEVERAIAAFQQAKEDLNLATLQAPSDGQILEINTYPGEIVGEDGVVKFGQTDRMLVIAEVYESDISKVNLGQTATIRSETGAFTGEIQGKVSQIGLQIGKQDVLNTDPAADVDSRVVEVKIRLDKESSDRVSHLTNSKAIVKISSK